MSLDDIESYLSQIKEYSDYVYLHVLGEPLLHKDIDKILEITDNLDLNVQLVTNGTLLNKNLNILSHKSLRKLSISIHSINTTNVDLEYFNTIEKIINKDTKTYIELRFYDFDNLTNDIKEFKDKLYSTYNITNTPKDNSYKIKNNVYIYFSELFNWPDINDPVLNKNGYCHGAIDQLAILHDGTLTLCCLDPKGVNSLGNLKDNTLKELLQSKNYLNIINNLKNKKLISKLCLHCSYRLRFDDKQN